MRSGTLRAIVIMGFILSAAFLVSCHNKSDNQVFSAETDSGKYIEIDESSNTKSHSANLISSPITLASDGFTPEPSPINNETNVLGELLIPYLDPDNSYYVGDAEADFIRTILLSPDNAHGPVAWDEWTKLIQLLFKPEKKHDNIFKKYTPTNTDGYIERQFAISILMELLSERYTPEKEQTASDASNVIIDLDSVGQNEKSLILKAYYSGFTDYTLDENNFFRPKDYLSRSEAISTLCRILTNYGYPALETSAVSNEPFAGENPQAAYSVESIFNECYLWVNEMNKSNNKKSAKKLETYKKAEEIIFADNSSSQGPLTLKSWLQILDQAMGVDTAKINSTLDCGKEGILTYDMAAVSIFSFKELYGGFGEISVTNKEFNNVHDSVSQFDTSQDTDKFAKLFVSGLIDGLYQVPGFTPQRPVNKAEALLLIKRIIEKS